MGFADDKELREFRDIMKPPDAGDFMDGFDWKTVVGALFLGFIMLPASEYLQLVVGPQGTIGAAARWVTVIMFAEISRRSFKDLKAQELYVLFFMTGLALSSPFSSYLWRQYFVQSEYIQAIGLGADLPSWAFPSAASIRENGHTLFSWAWVPVIAVTMFSLIVDKLDNYGLGYILYRITSDIERLPFPFAPVQAAGIVALSNERDEAQAWRWRCFAIGGMIGMLWGAIYIAVPIVTEAILPKRVEIIPLVFVDMTDSFSELLPAFPFNLVLDLSLFLSAMMVPFWGVVGGASGILVTAVLNPILYDAGILASWTPDMGFVDTMFVNRLDFYLSFELGLTLAVTVVSLGLFAKFLIFPAKRNDETADGEPYKSTWQKVREGWTLLVHGKRSRGDLSIWVALMLYVGTSCAWLGLGAFLVDGYPLIIFALYAFLYTPLISYATAKLEGICGQAVNIPYIKEATIILTGYQGVDIWFAPVPFRNEGEATVQFRVLELTGTKIKSQIKTIALTLPVVILSGFFTAELLWRMGDIPGPMYPYTEKLWDLELKQRALIFTATLEGGSQFLEAFSWKYLAWGVGSGSIVFMILSTFGLPVMLIFGAVWGLAQSSPGGMFLSLAGAMVGKFYFKRKYKDMWLKYMAVILAGFGCGMGLISMVAMSFTIITKMLSPLAF